MRVIAPPIATTCVVALTLLSALGGIGVPAQAQEKNATRSLDELARCKQVTQDTARLACFDRASDSIIAARKDGHLLALDRDEVVAHKRRAFGLTKQSESPVGDRAVDKAIVIDKVDTKIVGVRQTSYGRYRLDLANDTSWETIDPPALQPRAGAAITVKKASLGGFRATIAGGRSILVKRVR